MYRLFCAEDELSYGQRFLLDLIDSRSLVKWCKEHTDLVPNISTDYFFTYSFKIATGRFPVVSIKFIYNLRSVINPADWFHTVKEPRPEAIPEKNMFFGDEYDYKSSVNFAILKSLPVLKSWCMENGINYMNAWYILCKDRCVSYARILEMKHILKPENWFIRSSE